MAEDPRASLKGLKRELGLRDLILFSLAGIIGTRWLAAAAQTGPAAVVLWIAAAVFFFIPSAFAIGRLSGRYPDEGGLYIWTRNCFGEWHGFLCFWLYWLGLAFWFPSALMAFTSMAVYALGPTYVHLADQRGFVLLASLAAVWLALGANLLGLKTAKWIDNAGGASAYLLGLVLIGLAAAMAFRHGPATHFDFVPRWNWQTLNFWSQMAYALTGLELAPILGGEIRDPERNLPRSSFISTPFATAFYVLCTLALLVVLPAERINPLHGITQAVAAASGSLGMAWLTRAIAVFIVISALGQLSVIGSCAARLPFVVGVDRLLPLALARLHPRWRTPHISILTFGVVSTLFMAMTQAGDSLRAAYQTVTDMMVITGFVPFAYIFLCAWKCGARWSAASGLTVTLIALICSVVPTAEVQSPLLFEVKLAGITALLVISARIIYRSRK